MYDIEALFEAASVGHAISLLTEHPDAHIIAGGSDVLVAVREGRLAGAALVSIQRLDELRGVTLGDDGDLRIGALTSFSHIAGDPLIQRCLPVLGDAVSEVGGPQVRNIGTIGGNLANGVTSADSASTILAYDALLEYRGPNGTRMVPITEHYVSAGKTRLAHDELLVAVHVPKSSWEGTPGCYIKYAMRNAMDIATLGCSVNVRMEGKKVSRLRIAFGVAGPTVLRAPTAEALAQGKELTPELVEAVGDAVLQDINPRDSWRASKFLRQQVAKELTKRALMAAVERKPTKLDKAAPPLVRKTILPESLPNGLALVKCTVNGKARETVVDVRASLTDLLRNDYRLTSVKKGCEVGECGACNVIIDNECFNSCIYLAVWANGKNITTTEGLTKADGTLSALQQIFIDEGAVQCGFCTPGFLLSAQELIERAKAGETWTDRQLRKELSGHLCRCTGYVNIVKAVRRAISECTKVNP